MNRFGVLAASILDLVFPQACPGCDGTLSSDEDTWCASCTAKLLACTGVPYCPRCGLPAGPFLADAEGCRACRDHRTYTDGIARVGPYRGFLRDLVHRYKFGRVERLDRPLGRLLCAAIEGRNWAGEIDALVPVPTTWRNRIRYRSRPATQLARCVGRILALPSLPLVQVKGKKRDQVGLSTPDRKTNVRGVFRVRARARLAGTRLCIIDDVSTSGATLREVARSLRQAGATAVYAAVLAKTNPRESDGEQVQALTW